MSKEINLKYKPTMTQLQAHMSKAEHILFGGSIAGGKLVDINTLVLTPYGYKEIKNIHVGDEVIDIDGNIVDVAWESKIQYGKQAYKLIFDTGTNVLADAEHQWYVRNSKNRQQQTTLSKEFREKRKKERLSRSKNKKPWLAEKNSNREYKYKEPPCSVVMTTEQMYETKYIKLGNSDKSPNYTIDVNKPIQFQSKELLLDPYILGCWLGDGGTKNGTFTNPDLEIIEEFKNQGFDIHPLKDTRGYDWYVNGMLPILREIGIYDNKHIPKEYLFGSYEQRLALVQGLMDTDGSIGKNGKCEYSSCIEDITVGLKFLLNSLGIKTSNVNTNISTLYGVRKKDRHRLNFRTQVPVFRLKRKLERLPKKIRETQKYHYIKDIIKVESVPMKCIGVDSPTHTFLITDSFIATHNSVWGTCDMLQCCLDFAGNRVGIYRWENAAFSNTTYKTMEEWILDVPNLVKSHNQSRRSIILFNDSEILYGGLKPTQSTSGDIYSTIKSLELSACFVDEVTDVPERVFDMLSGRLLRRKARDVKTGKIITPPKRLCCSSNPELGWVKNRWVDQKLEGYEFIPSKASQNPYLPADYEEMLRKTMPESMVKQYVDGDWDAAIDFESIFPAKWLMNATKKEYEVQENDTCVIGVDVANYGDDKTVIVLRQGMKATILGEYRKQSTMDTAYLVANFADEYAPREINIDGIGVGAGVCDRLFEMDYPVVPIIGGESPNDERFVNKRSELHWAFRRLLEKGMVDLPNNSEVINEMGTIKYLVNMAERKIQVESKTAIKKRLGKSPDYNDAIIYAFADADSPYVIGGIL